MFRKRVLVILLVFGLLAVGFTACSKPVDRIVDKAKYRRAILDCTGSTSMRNEACVEAHFDRQAEIYCADNNIPTGECSEIRQKVYVNVVKYREEVEKESK